MPPAGPVTSGPSGLAFLSHSLQIHDCFTLLSFPKQRNGAFDVPSYRTLFLPPRQLCLGNTKTVNGVGDWSAEVFLGMRIKIGLRVFGQFPNAMSLSLPGTASVQSSWQ